jgi:hypothetical protein
MLIESDTIEEAKKRNQRIKIDGHILLYLWEWNKRSAFIAENGRILNIDYKKYKYEII